MASCHRSFEIAISCYLEQTPRSPRDMNGQVWSKLEKIQSKPYSSSKWEVGPMLKFTPLRTSWPARTYYQKARLVTREQNAYSTSEQVVVFCFFLGAHALYKAQNGAPFFPAGSCKPPNKVPETSCQRQTNFISVFSHTKHLEAYQRTRQANNKANLLLSTTAQIHTPRNRWLLAWEDCKSNNASLSKTSRQRLHTSFTFFHPQAELDTHIKPAITKQTSHFLLPIKIGDCFPS